MSKFITSLILGLVALTSSALQADDVIDEHKKALGSSEAIEKVKTFRRSGQMEMFNNKGTIEESAVVGKKSYQKIEMPNFKSTQVWNGEKGWLANSFNPSTELKEGQITQMKCVAGLNAFLAMAAELPAEKLISESEGDFEGIACKTYKLDAITSAYIGKDDHLLHGIVVKATTPAGKDASMKFIYSDFKEYDGVKFADKTVTVLGGGAFVITVQYTKTEINPDLTDALFEKP